MRRLIVFDLDGTLIDSRRDLAESANALLASWSGGLLSEEEIGRMVGDGAAMLVARAFAAAGLPLPDDGLERFLDIYETRLLRHTRPYPGVPDVLDVLGNRATLAVLTNKPAEATRQILEGLKLSRHFSDRDVVGGDGPFARKPDPAGLRHLMTSAGATPEETLLVGDSLIDWRTGQNASVRVCLARYGFGFAGFPTGELTANDWVLDQPEQLLGYV